MSHRGMAGASCWPAGPLSSACCSPHRTVARPAIRSGFRLFAAAVDLCVHDSSSGTSTASTDATLRWRDPRRSGIRRSICGSPASGCARRWICWRRCRSRRRRAWWISAAAPAMSPRSCGSAFPTPRWSAWTARRTMLEKARATVPDCRFEQADFFQWQPPRAARSDLLERRAAMGGPASGAVPAAAVVAGAGRRAGGADAGRCTTRRCADCRWSLPASGPWAEHLRGVASAPDILSPMEYWDLLRPHVASLDMWQTTYMHALSGENAVMEWASGSSLRAIPRPRCRRS